MRQADVGIEVHVGWSEVVRVVGRVAKSPVKVPDRSEPEFAVLVEHILVVAECAFGLEYLVIEDEIVEHQEADSRLHIDVIGDVLVVQQILDKGIHTILDDVKRQLRGALVKLRFLDVNRDQIGPGIEFLSIGLIIVVIQLKQRSHTLVIYLHTIVREADLFCQVITALISAVDIQVHRDDVVARVSFKQTGRFHADGIGQHGAIHLVGQQHPILALGQAQGRDLVRELEPIGIFGIRITGPRGVSAPLDLNRIGHRGEHASTVDDDFSVKVHLLAADAHSAHRVDIDARHRCAMVGEKIDIDHIL